MIFCNILDQISFLQAEILSQKTNTVGDLTNNGENGLLYSFLDDSQEQNNNFSNFQGNFRKKLKKAMSHDLRRFNSQQIFKSIAENHETEEAEPEKKEEIEENFVFKRKFAVQKENLQVFL